MGPPEIVQLIGVSTVAAVAIIGVIAVSVRAVLVPSLKARRLAAQAATAPPDLARVDARMDALEEEMRHLGQVLDRVAAAAEFDAQLRAGAASTPVPPAQVTHGPE